MPLLTAGGQHKAPDAPQTKEIVHFKEPILVEGIECREGIFKGYSTLTSAIPVMMPQQTLGKNGIETQMVLGQAPLAIPTGFVVVRVVPQGRETQIVVPASAISFIGPAEPL